MALAVNAQKFGHISAELLLQDMPDYDSAQAKIEDLRSQYDLEIERIQVEINKKIEEYNKNEATMSNLIKEAKASEIQEMQIRLQNFAQTAQQDLQQQSMTLMQPVMDKARKAIEAVAKEKGLIYVFDMSQGNPVYASQESLDMLPLVKQKLGL
jgi:outer membrane protein